MSASPRAPYPSTSLFAACRTFAMVRVAQPLRSRPEEGRGFDPRNGGPELFAGKASSRCSASRSPPSDTPCSTGPKWKAGYPEGFGARPRSLRSPVRRRRGSPRRTRQRRQALGRGRLEADHIRGAWRQAARGRLRIPPRNDEASAQPVRRDATRGARLVQASTTKAAPTPNR